ncbi:uncharacterized protein [Porites lutea]|uniref:uncharacterized protein n=1 Tax=Porites lutea TaxID=51062 RepID=UPI003CC62E36
MVIQSFLCCFSIYEGSWICGILSLILGVLRVGLQWFTLVFRHRMTKEARKLLPIKFSTLQLITIFQISVAAISMVVAVVMLVGLFKRWRWLLCPWMVWVVLEELFSILVIIFYVVYGVKLNCSVYISDAILFFIFMYFVLCVYSYFKDLRRQQLVRMFAGISQFTPEGDGDGENPRTPLLINRPV